MSRSIAVIYIKFRKYVDQSKCGMLTTALSDCKTRFRFFSIFFEEGLG